MICCAACNTNCVGMVFTWSVLCGIAHKIFLCVVLVFCVECYISCVIIMFVPVGMNCKEDICSVGITGNDIIISCV